MRCRPFEYIKSFLFFMLLFGALNSHAEVVTGAEQLNLYLPLLKDKKVALAVNPTSVIRKTHLVDTLRKLKVNISCIFAPEHGFRGDKEAGAPISNSKDKKTGIPVISLYGNHKKPTPADLKQVDVVVFDIQDVGARFYTYISTLHYIMEACAEQQKQLVILDRPNPNGFYIDGPVLDTAFRSFVGMHPVPVVHGLTIGEYAQMINGEGWLRNAVQCRLKVITLTGYDHNTRYVLPVKPSPNLPTMQSVYLYPGLCLFEGTSYSVGRGTPIPFECVGNPGSTEGNFTFTPKPIKGVADNPPHANKLCRGYRLTSFADNVFATNPRMELSWLIAFYQQDTAKSTFFNSFFDKLAGSDQLRTQILAGKTEEEIRSGWKPGIEAFRKKRMKYLLYPDFTYIYELGK